MAKPHIKIIQSVFLAVLLAGCKLSLVSDQGGSIVSRTGTKDCSEATTCDITVRPGLPFSDTFTAVPKEGYEFVGWGPGLCTGQTGPCVLEGVPGRITAHGRDMKLHAIFKSNASLPVYSGLQLQSQFSNTSEYTVVTDDIWAIWWHKSFDHSEYSQWLINELRSVRQQSILELGMSDPPNPKNGAYYNIYIHHGEDDPFPEWWALGQGTDDFGHPYLTFPGEGSVQDVDHEGFHVFQYEANSSGFEYCCDSEWYVEATAQWFAAIRNPAHPNSFLEGGIAEGNPQLALWHTVGNGTPQDPSAWMYSVHPYAMHTYLFYLTNVVGVDPLLISRGFYQNLSVTPQQYLYEQIGADTLRRYFTDWAASNVDDFNYLTVEQVEVARENGQFWAQEDGNQYPRYAATYPDGGTSGAFVRPSQNDAPRGWSYNVIRTAMGASAGDTYRFEIRGDVLGSESASAHFEARVVVKTPQSSTITSVVMTNNTDGYVDIVVPAGATDAYLVVAAVPEHFGGNQTYNYDFFIGRQ